MSAEMEAARGSVGPPAWEAFADAVLAREALLARRRHGRPPDDFAGLYVADDDVEQLVAELPGFLGGLSDPEPLAKQLEDMVDEARDELFASLAADSRFARVAAQACLTTADVDVLALVAAVELDLRRQRLVGYVQDNVTLTRITLAALARVFPAPHPGPLAVAADARLRRSGLVAVEGGGPWATSTVAVPSTVAWALVGDDSLDPALPTQARLVEGDPGRRGDESLVFVTGADRTRRLELACATAARSEFLVSPLPAGGDGWEALVRQATLSGRAVVLEVDGLDLPAEAVRWLERADHVCWAITSPTPLPLASLPRRAWVEHVADDAPASDADWREKLGRAPADGHRLTRDQLRLVATASTGLGQDLGAAIRRLAGGHLDGRARRIQPRRRWDDLVLPPEQRSQLQELAGRYRHRDTVYERWGFTPVPSAGLVALFAGPSGTGKTLAAEVVAGELGLDLYKIDLSSVVSKYIGETEKNLEALFDAAAVGNLVLFFDEADSLFGRRSEVSDAHDRYANIEVSYLLQRIERYDGLLVLATNLQNNIDTAFLRRVHVAVEFPLPDEAERRAIWELSFPATCPTDDLDLDFLAHQFKLAGGSIRNIALHAAFLAADDGSSVTMERVVAGIKRELHKLGRLCTEAEFDRYFPLVTRSN